MSAIAFLQRLLDAGLSIQEALSVAEAFNIEGPVRKPLAEGLRALSEIGIAVEHWPTVIQAVECLKPLQRSRPYGPLQDPDAYWSDEKARAYSIGYQHTDGPVTPRLTDASWWPLVGRVFRRDGHACTYCGAGEDYVLHCDHIAPISRGGSNDIENLTTACEACNCSKRDKLPHEWRPNAGGFR